MLRAHGGPIAVALGNLRGRGHADIAVANFESGDISLLFNHGNGTFFGPSLNQDVFAWDSTGINELASDQSVGLRSLRFTGSTLHWVAGGHPRHHVLH